MTKKLLLALWACLFAFSGCGVKQPKVANAAYSSPASNHLRYTAPCSDCHEYRRPGVESDIDIRTRQALTVPHGFGRSCGECHKYDPAAPWAALAYSHSPTPPSCLGCHSITREANPHEARGDCSNCHAFPDWAKLK